MGAQIIDDGAGHTLVSASTREKDATLPKSSNVADRLGGGELIAARALEKGIETVRLPRCGVTDTMMFLLFSLVSFLAMFSIFETHGGWVAAMEGLTQLESKPNLMAWHGMSGPGQTWTGLLAQNG